MHHLGCYILHSIVEAIRTVFVLICICMKCRTLALWDQKRKILFESDSKIHATA
jgi:hypothetical protein